MFLKPFPIEVFRVFSKKFFGNRSKNHFSKKNLAKFSRICPFPISFPNLVHSLLVLASYKFTWMFLKPFPRAVFRVFSKKIFGNRLKNHFSKKNLAKFSCICPFPQPGAFIIGRSFLQIHMDAS